MEARGSFERSLPVGVAALALAIGAWNAWSLSSISDRIDAIEATSAGAPATERPGRGGPRFARDVRPGDEAPALYPARPERWRGDALGTTEAVAASDADDPEFREKVASVMAAEEERRDTERRAMFEEAMRSEITTFAAEEGLDEATTKALLAQVEARSEAFRAIRDDVRAGVIGWPEARAEMEALHEEGGDEATRLLGEERADRLEARLHGARPGPGGGWR